ncbi:stage II sporulation protein P [Bacillus badius]|uniref:Stage II sporulation protein P n=1 Tax=Bacillus badius TaxID=1455 RepID=A0ABR5AY25_BACBA|nr:stage II sporulation protein P [Bacillus badius]KIL79641.1 Stage II sporulation protein P [Bacillus badius]MED4717313.1 stage II sporulation protein P [Bacillus badius]
MKENQPYELFSINLSTILKGTMIFTLSLLSLFSFAGMLTSLTYNYRLSSHSVNEAAENVSGGALYYLYTMENKLFAAHAPEGARPPSLSEVAFRYATNVRFQDPRSFLGREVPGFSIYDGEILVAGEGTDYTNMPIESEPPDRVLDKGNDVAVKPAKEIPREKDSPPPSLATGGKKRVYLYFTHTRESYLPHLQGVSSADSAHHSALNVTKVGEMVRKALEAKGIGTTVDKTDIVAKLDQSGRKYSQSYQESRALVASAQSNHRDLQYFIDIHRDSQRKEVTTASINGKDYAKVVFVVGGEHANYEKNVKLATQWHNLLEKKYKGLSRGVILKQGKNTNGKFNQDLSDKAMLIEFGGVDNTFEELNRTAEAFADVFADYYWQAEAVQAD